MKGYTGTGDRGETGLYGGSRVGKENLRVEAYGSVDELNSQIGLVRALARGGRIDEVLRVVQRDLFVLGGDLSSEVADGKVPRVERKQVEGLEKIANEVFAELSPLRRFVLPGGGVVGAELHVARSVCRRAERRVVALARAESVNSEVVPYLNRLSSLLFELARLANKMDGFREEEWVRD